MTRKEFYGHLKHLDDLIAYSNSVDSFSIKSIGGFALLEHEIRITEVTEDIDSVVPFSEDVRKLILKTSIESVGRNDGEKAVEVLPILRSTYFPFINNKAASFEAAFSIFFRHIAVAHF